VKRAKVSPAAAQWLAELFGLHPGTDEDYAEARELLIRGRELPGPFEDHELKGELQGWRAFEVGGDARVIYFADRESVTIVAAGPHDLAYERARGVRRDGAGRVSRRRQKARRRE
jgi:mRNA-degrading endonuclease YafQ of YafQ-DinJ toxin-antitoxin module